MKIIVYGLGSGIDRVEKYIKNQHNIIGYSDSYYNGDNFNNRKFYKPSELKNVYFDYIVISVGDCIISSEIKKYLLGYGIEKEKIIDFYLVYRNYVNIQKSIREKEDDNYESIVLGISHSLYGISKRCLKYRPLKLCSGRQDLYYNLEKLKINREIIKKCKCAIIDMHTYTYFNYDVSLSKAALEYILENDFIDNPHNFIRNSNYENSIIEEIKLMDLQSFEELFDTYSIDVLEDYIQAGMYSRKYLDVCDKRCINENLNFSKVKQSSIEKNIYTSTEKENIGVFEEILRILKEENEDIRIYLVLIPQYKKVEINLREYEKDWKIRFYDIINELQEKYKFKILDFKDNEEISDNFKYYCDPIHLNGTGAMKFTQLLNSYID